MATLTFLRIGKEIHDELEDILADHLIERQEPGHAKLRWKLNNRKNAILSMIAVWSGFNKII